jgi:hypothetical protein
MKKIFLFVVLACSLIVNMVKADSYPVPNNYVKIVTATSNTNGVQQLIDCSKAGMRTLTAQVTAGATATVVVQAVGANTDGTPNMASAMVAYTLLSTASGTSSPLLVPDTSSPFYNIYSATTGVALTYIASCK